METGKRTTRQRRYRRLGLVLLIASVSTIACAIVLARSWFPARFLVMKLEGRVEPRCSLDLALESRRHRAERLDAAQRGRAYAHSTGRDGNLTRWQTPYGPVWTSPRDVDSARTAGEFYESHTIRWARIDGSRDWPVREGDVVLDLGAHVGESTRAALDLGADLVVTVEPDPDNLDALRRNLARDIRDGRVIVIPKGVYDRTGTLAFEREHATSRDGRFEDGASGESLPITTVDQLVSDLGLTRVDFIKMDIEGAEVPALHGARDTILRFRPRLAVGTYHLPGDLSAVEDVVQAYRSDYEVTPSRCLDEFYGRLFPQLLYFH